MNICILSGTNRPGSNTLKLSRWIAQRHREAGAAVSLVDLQDMPPEALSPSAYDTRPAALDPLIDPLMQSDGLVVVTPEYNGGMPGVLKLFIDLLPFPEAFEGRPVCFVGLAAGRWGALRPVEQLQGVFGYRNAFQLPERLFIPRVHQALDPDGAPRDAEIRGLLVDQASKFQAFCRKLKAS